MNILHLLKHLNNKQLEAVTAPQTNMLILAGAGSGKTRVLIYRIAWLILVEKISPFSIIAVTFTNKAASEMRYRINLLIGDAQKGIWIGTFHGLAHRLLRIHYVDNNLPQDFQILDNDDQYSLLRRIIKSMNLNKNKWLLRQVIYYINTKKDEGLYPQYIKNFSNKIEEIWLQIYKIYQKICDRSGLIDFAEILLRVNEMWLKKPNILQYYRNRFTNILIDEFQDTNNIQYSWIRILTGDTGKVMVVGDDDQSIYSWRGAKIENIKYFLKDFPSTNIIKLEQNYRSTNNILKAANVLISNNNNRLGKNLWTNKVNGELISLYCGSNELDEADYIVNYIKKWKKNGGFLKECAILYRNSIQSKIIEEFLLKSSISYHIYGSQRFFERQEIKDIFSYLRLIVNRNNDASFERIINRPSRGIGEQTLNIIRYIASKKEFTLWQSCEYLLIKKNINFRAIKVIQQFIKLINFLDTKIVNLPLYVQIDYVIKESGLLIMYKQEKDKKSQLKISNLMKLITITREFYYKYENKELISLQSFLSYFTLESYEGQLDLNKDSVQLMTLHSAKGLEFPLVFIIGMEEGIWPSQKSIEENGKIFEERRLAYVGLTRAMKKLILTYVENRRLYGKLVYYYPSRFINELPVECIEKIHLNNINL